MTEFYADRQPTATLLLYLDLGPAVNKYMTLRIEFSHGARHYPTNAKQAKD